MQRPSLITRRFYCAFYRWSILQDASQVKPRCQLHWRNFHSSTGSFDAAESDVPTSASGELNAIRRTPVRIKKHSSESLFPENHAGDGFDTPESDGLLLASMSRPSPGTDKRPRVRTRTSGQKTTPIAPVKNVTTFPWLASDVQSAEQYRFERLSPYEAAVRYRGGAGIVLEYAIPQGTVDALKNVHGDKLDSLARQIGAAIELGDANPVTNLRSVLVSGNVDEAKEMEKILQQYNRVQRTEQDEDASGLANDLEPHIWLDTVPPLTKGEPPPELVAWQFVRRRREKGVDITIETCVPESWYELHHDKFIHNVMRRNVKLEFEPAMSFGSSEKLVPCSLTGKTGKLHTVAQMFRFEQAAWNRTKRLFNLPRRFDLTALLTTELLSTITERSGMPRMPMIQTNPVDSSGLSVMLEGGDDTIEKAIACLNDEFFNIDAQTLEKMKVKGILSILSNPVVLITTKDPSLVDEVKSSEFSGYRGVTVSSFNSVSLDPEPVMSFNLRLPSRSWDAISQAKHCFVHVLQGSKAGVTVANAFTTAHEDPTTPFQQLKDVGMSGYNIDSEADAPVLSPWPYAVLAVMRMSVMEEKCVHVGDHVIVLAKLENIWVGKRHVTSEQPETGLAYSKKKYGRIGAEILPLDHKQPAASTGKSKLNERMIEKGQARNTAAVNESERLSSEAFERYFEEAQRFDDEEIPSEKEHSAHDPSDKRNSSSAPLGSANSSSANATSPRHSLSSQSWDSSSFSTLSPSHRSDRRNYSSAALPSHPEKDIRALVSSPKILNDRVSDFLCEYTDEFVRPRRMRSLLHAQQNSLHAAAELNLVVDGGMEHSEKAAHLKGVILANDRLVVTKLALGAADDLRRMLDRGRVDVERARWLESAIEKGQAVLLDEARELSRALRNGSLEQDEFTEAKKKELETHFDILRTEAMRLRSMADEDEAGED